MGSGTLYSLPWRGGTLTHGRTAAAAALPFDVHQAAIACDVAMEETLVGSVTRDGSCSRNGLAD